AAVLEAIGKGDVEAHGECLRERRRDAGLARTGNADELDDELRTEPARHGGAASMASAEPAHQVRSERVHEPSRQPPPGGDQQPVARVQRVVLRDAVTSEQPVLVAQRRRLEAPVALEVEGPGAALAAPIVEDAA